MMKINSIKLDKNRKGLMTAWLCALAVLICAAVPLNTFAAPDKTEKISVPFENPLTHQIYDWEYPYSDGFFRAPSNEFSVDLACASMGLTVSAFSNEKEYLENQYETYLTGAGFSDIHAFGYDQDTSKDTLAGVIGWKQIDDFILIAAVPRGQGYGKEWAGNLEVGKGVRHEGFEHAAQIMEGEIRNYIEKNGLSGRKKLWVSGFSRASAVSNITAADMIESGDFEDVYAYLFAVPRTTKDPENYPGIFNICGKYDPVTQIPLQSWGYERYGTDLYTPAAEMNNDYLPLYLSASDVSFELTGDYFQNNPEVNFQLHLIIEFMGELFPTSDEYADKFQDILMDIWNEEHPSSIGVILTKAISQLDDLDSRQEYSSAVFLDYLTFLMSQHVKEEQRQVNNLSWDPSKTIAENVMLQHMSYIYVDWIFSDSDVESVFYGPEFTRRLTISGNVDVEIWQDDQMVAAVNKNGEEDYGDIVDRIFEAESEEDLKEILKDSKNVFIMRDGTDTLTSLPMDQDFRVLIRADEPEQLVYYDVIWSPYATYGIADKMSYLYVQPGEYVLDIENYTDLPAAQVLEGSIVSQNEVDFNYSPTMEMAQESSASTHLTLIDILSIIFWTVIFILAVLLACLIIFIVHAARKKKRGRPYSPLYVIIPHAFLITVFVLETQFFTYNMFTIGKVRQILAIITMVILTLLALRGLIRSRCISNLIILGGIVAASVFNIVFYQNSSLVSSATLNFVIYLVCIAGLTVLAASTFYRKKKTDAVAGEM